MFVCICNAIRDRDVTRVIRGGAACPDEVYSALGCRPACGRCRDEIRDMLSDLLSPRGAEAAAQPA